MSAKRDFEKITLPNGVRLLLIPMTGVNSVATSVKVGVGSRYETKEINGISHFLEHMVFKGTKKYPTTDDVNVIERIGGLQNAYTDIDITNYHNKVLSSDWELALDINKELALMPLLQNEHIDRERSVILEEMKRYEDEPSAKAEEAIHTIMYPGTRLGMRIIGEEKSLKNVGADTLREYHIKWYRQDKIVVVMAGDVMNYESRIMNQVKNWFGGLNGKSDDEIEIAKDGQTIPQVKVVTKPDAQQAHFFLGLRTFGRGSEERFAWNVFNLLMGVSFTSRLFREIREKRGLCYHIRSNSNNWADVGNWQIYAGVATDKVEEAVSATLAELSKVREKGVTDDEVAIAKKRLKTIYTFKSEDPEFMNEYYGRQEVFDVPIMTLSETINKVDQVTKTDVDKLTAKYLKTTSLNMSLVWNKPTDDKLLGLLKI